MDTLQEQLLKEIDDFCDKYKVSYYKLGTEAVNNNKVVSRIKNGTDIRSVTVNRIRRYIRENSK